MSGYVGVLVSDPWLQSQFTQVELRTLKSNYVSGRTQAGRVTVGDLPPVFVKLKAFAEVFNEDEIKKILGESYSNPGEELDFETFLRAYLNVQARVPAKSGGRKLKSSSSFLKASTTTFHHNINESEKASYVSHINNYLGEDSFLCKYLPIDAATNELFDLVKDGVLLCKLINVAVPGTIDERAINTKKVLNPWERNENHTLCLNSAKAIGCTVVNIGTQDLVEARPHLVLGLISQIIKIQLLADLNLKKTPQLLELVDDSKEVEELMGLAPEKVLLKWMNFHLKKAGYTKQVTNFSSDVKDGEAYVYLLNALAPELSTPATQDSSNPTERANMVLEVAEKLDCKRYLTSQDIVEGSPNLNLAFVAQIFQHRNGLTVDTNKMSFAEMMEDDVETSREERCFRLWINSLGIFTYVNNVFEDVRNGWVLLEVLDKVSPDRLDAHLTFASSFIHSIFVAADEDKSLSNGIFFLELLSSVEPRVVNWAVVTKGESDEDKKMNATYIISVARKLGCSIFLLPEDIIEINQKMMLILTASIMYWSLQQQDAESESSAADDSVESSTVSMDGDITMDAAASDTEENRE
ncbi:hypothetical protein GH714_020530 [Hevea brasiliensis]|uniref:Calponin-homology (CH) domain-containing protein n=1 Tax=Hevea brasiliensis TaxID=3981 RepID=A0A6A6KWM1_HEVBR|nr:hypothetical protein GH714_020530 [Hevea brasiliensis]